MIAIWFPENYRSAYYQTYLGHVACIWPGTELRTGKVCRRVEDLALSSIWGLCSHQIETKSRTLWALQACCPTIRISDVINNFANVIIWCDVNTADCLEGVCPVSFKARCWAAGIQTHKEQRFHRSYEHGCIWIQLSCVFSRSRRLRLCRFAKGFLGLVDDLHTYMYTSTPPANNPYDGSTLPSRSYLFPWLYSAMGNRRHQRWYRKFYCSRQSVWRGLIVLRSMTSRHDVVTHVFPW